MQQQKTLKFWYLPLFTDFVGDVQLCLAGDWFELPLFPRPGLPVDALDSVSPLVVWVDVTRVLSSLSEESVDSPVKGTDRIWEALCNNDF